MHVSFANGTFLGLEGKRHAIQSMLLAENGAFVQTATTECSAEILRDLSAFLEEAFQFPLKSARLRRDFAAQVVVQFDHQIESSIAKLNAVGSLIREALALEPSSPFGLKRISFGKQIQVEPASLALSSFTLDGVDLLDFILERRANEPFEENRYFASAAIGTEDLFFLLEKIELILIEGK